MWVCFIIVHVYSSVLLCCHPRGFFTLWPTLAAVPLQDTLEMCSKEIEFKCILFALCYFHAVVAERRKFGAQGWNRSYPFNNGDLTISINVLYNYLEANPKVKACAAALPRSRAALRGLQPADGSASG